MPKYISSYGHIVLEKPSGIFVKCNQVMRGYSTSPFNGGIRNIQYVFNHQLKSWIETSADLPGGSVEGYLQKIATESGWDHSRTTGLMTTASMQHAAIVRDCYKDAALFAVITAGTRFNAVRAGEPGAYYEISPGSFVPLSGTINIILILEFALPEASLARTPIIITEAKCAALQEHRIPSCNSHAIATGTGTDGMIVLCNPSGSPCFTDVGTHSKVGELIGRTVFKGVIEALEKEGSIR